MEAECRAVQEGQPLQGRHGVCGRVQERRGRRGAVGLLPREEGLRLLRRMSVPGRNCNYSGRPKIIRHGNAAN